MLAIPLKEFRGKVATLYRAKKTKTRKRMHQLLTELVELAGPDGTTADLTTDFLAGWMAERIDRWATWTRIGYLGYVRAACSWAIEEGWLDREPSWRRLRPSRARRPPVRPLTREQTWRLLCHLHDRSLEGGWLDWRLEAAATTAACAGLRRNELLYLRQVDVDLGERLIEVVPIDQRELKTEESSVRLVPICSELSDVLRWWLPSAASEWVFPGARHQGPWSGGARGYRPIDQLRRAGRECGVDVEGWQTLRATWATQAETLWGLDEPAIWRCLGHSSALTSRRWYRAADRDNLRAIGDRIRFAPAHQIEVPGVIAFQPTTQETAQHRGHEHDHEQGYELKRVHG
jgi:integrase